LVVAEHTDPLGHRQVQVGPALPQQLDHQVALGLLGLDPRQVVGLLPGRPELGGQLRQQVAGPGVVVDPVRHRPVAVE
jgi:hypothetical protein